MKSLTASDRSALIRLAASLPVGNEGRRAILAGLAKVSAPVTLAALESAFSNAKRAVGLLVKSDDTSVVGPASGVRDSLGALVSMMKKGNADESKIARYYEDARAKAHAVAKDIKSGSVAKSLLLAI